MTFAYTSIIATHNNIYILCLYNHTSCTMDTLDQDRGDSIHNIQLSGCILLHELGLKDSINLSFALLRKT